jgi:hypothetical protein
VVHSQVLQMLTTIILYSKLDPSTPFPKVSFKSPYLPILAVLLAS